MILIYFGEKIIIKIKLVKQKMIECGIIDFS